MRHSNRFTKKYASRHATRQSRIAAANCRRQELNSSIPKNYTAPRQSHGWLFTKKRGWYRVA